jgi:hypothetical protein
MVPLGGLITLVVLLPNLIIVFFPPTQKLAGDLSTHDGRLQMMTIIERIGQVGSFAIPFFYQLPQSSTLGFVAVLIMSVTVVFYYAGWIRYLVGRTESLFYRPLLGIPLPMAVMPVTYFFAASIWLGSVWLMIAAVLLGIGHITVTWLNSQRIT